MPYFHTCDQCRRPRQS